MVNRATQIMSSACQKRLKHIKRRIMLGRNPFVQICAIIVPSHNKPAVTWAPWQPTKVKNADRKALRLGPAPIHTTAAQSLYPPDERFQQTFENLKAAVWSPFCAL
jgi:hypothetical protein